MFAINENLIRSRRWKKTGEAHCAGVTGLDLAILVLLGMGAAALSTFVDLNLKMPGHAILKSILPISLGLALVPRKGAGTAMGTVALLSALIFKTFGMRGDGLSLGSLTSLFAIGLCLDFAAKTILPRLGPWPAFAIGGLMANTLAFTVRGTAKWVGWEHAGARPLASWLSQAVVTYLLCGLLAGLVAGMIGFRFREPRGDQQT